MSKRVEALVWDRSRAGKSDLLMLVKIADLCPEDTGHNCYAEVPYLARQIRSTLRGAQYILQRLVDAGEVEIEHNDEGREIVTRGGRKFRPKWFIHVRCVCAWETYQTEAKKPAKIADSHTGLRPGRPRRKPAKIADSDRTDTRKDCSVNRKESAPKCEKTGSAYKEGSGIDPVVEQEQGAAPQGDHQKPADEDPEKNLGVITKLAHEVLDLYEGLTDVRDDEVTESVKVRCSKLHIAYWPGDVVHRAIASAVFQRQRAGKSAVLDGSSGESAFRLRHEAS